MRIAIDCRYLGKSGIGRVCEGVLDALDLTAHEYYLIGKRDRLARYTSRGAHLVEDASKPYSIAGLFSFDRSLNRKCDALLIPNFLVPFGVRIPILSIMHDLAFLDVKETTRGAADRMIKKTLLKRCMRRSKKIACVSQFTLDRCRHYYGKLAEKCFVNYNGVSEGVFAYAKEHAAPLQKRDTIVFVGNVKPHKGLNTLLSAFLALRTDTTLRIIGEKDNFLTGLSLEEDAYRNVTFTGKLDDDRLFEEIACAKYLVLPSRYEGFGLPPLEALCLGTQPILSDIPVFREIYRDLPVKFFRDEAELTARMRETPDRIDCTDAVRTRYNFHRCADQLIHQLEELCRR